MATAAESPLGSVSSSTGYGGGVIDHAGVSGPVSHLCEGDVAVWPLALSGSAAYIVDCTFMKSTSIA